MSNFRFLFGTCCLLKGDIETSLANVINKKNQTALDKQDELNNRPQIVNNHFYGTNNDESGEQQHEFKIATGAVHVTSPSYHPTEHPTTAYYGSSQQQSYATELPSRIHMSTASLLSSSDDSHEVQFSKDPYDHSDISYEPSDSDILMGHEDEDNHINGYQSSTVHPSQHEKRTEEPEKNKYSKPFFKLKPTTAAVTEKYVLVHTISNERPSGELSQENLTRKPVSSENDSIQSILLMLNESNPAGPEYSVVNDDSSNTNVNYSPVSVSTPSYGSTTMIDRDQYGATSYYITTKHPSSPSSTIKHSPSKKTTTKFVNNVKLTSTKAPLRFTTPTNIPSTSYVYSPNPIRKRPTASATPSTTSATSSYYGSSSDLPIKQSSTTSYYVKKTTPTKPANLILKKPSSTNEEDNYVVISGGGMTKHPSPTVHITPKPITNILTASTVQQLFKKPTKLVTGSQTIEYPSSTPATIIQSSIYLPANQDFHNEGYFVVTHSPPTGSVSSTAVYSIINNQPTSVKITGTYGDVVYGQQQDNLHLDESSSSHIGNDDLTNFPPVRNPNLNMSATNAMLDESEISTPTFIEDDNLNNKIDLLVSKLVASMQGNLDNLMDIVYERKNVTDGAIKNGTLADSKPSKPAKLPSTTTRPPSRVTTGRPGTQTTKKAPTKAATTKKPVSSAATKRPTSSSQTTKRPPQRGTTASTTLSNRRTTRRTTTPTTSTERAPEIEDDEIVEEEGVGGDDADGEAEEENIVEEGEGEPTQPPTEFTGRIRKFINCQIDMNFSSLSELEQVVIN